MTALWTLRLRPKQDFDKIEMSLGPGGLQISFGAGCLAVGDVEGCPIFRDQDARLPWFFMERVTNRTHCCRGSRRRPQFRDQPQDVGEHAAHLTVGVLGQTDRAGLSDPFQSRSGC
jgi:hypothetical protein